MKTQPAAPAAGQTLPDATPPVGKIHPFNKITGTFDLDALQDLESLKIAITFRSIHFQNYLGLKITLGYAKYSFYDWLRYFITIGLGDTINKFRKVLLTQNNHLIKPGYPTVFSKQKL